MASLLVNYSMNSTTVAHSDGTFSTSFSDSNIIHGPGNTVFGDYFQALSLGADGKAECDISTLLINFEQFCINVVFNATDAVNARQTIVESDLLPFSIFLSAGSTADTFNLTANVKPQNHDWSGPDTLFKQELTLGEWYAVSLAYDEDTLALFIDNELIAVHAFPEGVIERLSGEKLYFGTSADGESDHFSGELACFQWYDGIPSELEKKLKERKSSSAEWFITYKYEEFKKTFQTGARTGRITALSSIDAYIQHYENCAIMYHPSLGEAFEMHGEVYARYKGLPDPSSLGYLVSDESDTTRAGGRKSLFSKGGIYWSAATGAHPVTDRIYAEYEDLDESASCGFPMGAGGAIPNGVEQEFQKSEGEFTISYRSYHKNEDPKAFVVQGSILSKYLATGGVSRWGFPVSNESDVKNVNTVIGKYSEFENCTIYSSGVGTFEVHGAIRERYRGSRESLGYLGFPTSDEIGIPGVAGVMNTFQNGSILSYAGGLTLTAVPFRIFIDRIESERSEGIWDTGQNDLYIKTLRLTQNGTVIFEQRIPEKGDWSEQDNVDLKRPYGPVINTNDPNMTLELYIDIWEADSFMRAGDDHMGSYTKILNASNAWGLLDGSYNRGRYEVQFGKIRRLTWSINADVDIDSLSDEQKWWGVDNNSTPIITYEQYALAFKIDPNRAQWKPTTWLEETYYNLFVKKSADGGNCFGMSLEALYSWKKKSSFGLPLNRFTDWNEIRNEINIKQIYQLGAAPLWWYVKQFLTGKIRNPVAVFNRALEEFDRGNNPILCLRHEGSGHAIVPIRWDKSKSPWVIDVLDPNVPSWDNDKGVPQDPIKKLTVNSDENTYSFIFSYETDDNNDYKRDADGNLIPIIWSEKLVYMPFSLVSERQRSVVWDLLLLLLGGTILILGDAGETESITDDEGRDLDAFGVRATELLRNNGSLPTDFFVGTPVLDSSIKPGQLLLREESHSRFIHNIKGVEAGEFNYCFKSGFNELNLVSALDVNEIHSVDVDDQDDVCKVQLNSQREKNLTFTIRNRLGFSGDYLECTVHDMPIGPTHGLEASFKRGIAGLDLVNRGDRTRLNVTIKARRNGIESTKSFVIPMDEGVSLNPLKLITEILISHIDLNETHLTMIPGLTELLIATIGPDNATRKTVRWTSDNTAVAAIHPVAARSLVTAFAAGSALVTVKAADVGGVSADCAITVIPGIRPDVLSEVWSGYTLSRKDNGVSVLELDESKKVADWAQIYIPVPGVTDTGTKFSADFVELTIRNVGGSITDFCVNLDNGSDKNSYREAKLLWPSREELLNGNGDTIVHNAGGTTTLRMDLRKVYAEFKGKGAKSVRLKIFVESVPEHRDEYDRSGTVEFIALNICDANNTLVTSITLNKASAILPIGGTEALSATVSPANASNKALAWTSSNTAVATVNANGLVTAVAIGVADVTAIAVDGSGTSATCAVRVAIPGASGSGPEIISEAWSGYTLSHKDDGTPIITLGGAAKVPDWAQIYISLPGVTDTGTKFSADFAELTIRNVNQSISDFCVNLDNASATPYKEAELLWPSREELLNGNGHSVLKNANGTTTLRLDLGSMYGAFKGKCAKGVRLKIFIESVPERRAQYDRVGSVEFVALNIF